MSGGVCVYERIYGARWIVDARLDAGAGAGAGADADAGCWNGETGCGDARGAGMVRLSFEGASVMGHS